MKRSPIVVGLDIGTAKICCLVAESRPEGLEVIGVGTARSQGMKKGMVNDIGAIMQSISKAVQDAETMCGRQVESVYTGISGAHVLGMDSHGMIVVKGNEITEADIHRVVETAQTVTIPPEREILHIIPQEFIVDNHAGIKEPVGMSGKRLEAKVHIVTASVSNAQNIYRCCNSVGLNIADTVLSHMASATAVLTEDEKELGVCLVDIGGGTTDVAVYSEGALRHTHVVNLAGAQFTNDLAIGLRTSMAAAQKIKEKHGCVFSRLINKSDLIEVSGVGGQGEEMIKRQQVLNILAPRAEEIIGMVRLELEKSGWYKKIPAGVVLTGGSSQLEGMEELAREMLGLPVRKGVPTRIGGLVDVVRNPVYATAVGLIQYGVYSAGDFDYQAGRASGFSRVRARMRSWVADIFGN